MKWLFSLVLVASALIPSRAHACSCIKYGDHPLFYDLADAPLNFRPRVSLMPRAEPPKLVLRPFLGAAVPCNARTWTDDQYLDVELVPTKPLAPKKLYEVFLDNDLLARFVTGTTIDRTAPVLTSVGTAASGVNPSMMACNAKGPWVNLDPMSANDPGRPHAELLYAVWLLEPNGVLDPTRPPDRLLPLRKSVLELGKESICQNHDFPIPKAKTMTVAVAAVDDAGNASDPQTMTVQLP